MAEQIRKRCEIDAKYKWDLTHIYADTAAWEADFARAGKLIDEFAAFDGKVAEDPRKVIRAYFDLNDQLTPVFEYAFLNKETDNADPAAQAMSDRMRMMGVQFGTKTAFVVPELLELDEAVLKEIEQDHR